MATIVFTSKRPPPKENGSRITLINTVMQRQHKAALTYRQPVYLFHHARSPKIGFRVDTFGPFSRGYTRTFNIITDHSTNVPP
jgi:hypothetical protein